MTENRNEIHLVGLTLPFKTTNANGQSGKDCGALWQKFMTEAIAEKVQNKSGEELIAVYFDYDGDHTQPYRFFVGCPVSKIGTLPEGLSSLTLPAGSYHKVTAAGAIPNCIANAWRKIWGSDLKRAYRFDYEVYGAKSRDWSNGEVDIFLS